MLNKWDPIKLQWPIYNDNVTQRLHSAGETVWIMLT